VLAHSRLVATIAREFVERRTGNADVIGDSLGADLFATGLVAVWETVKTLRFSPTCDSPESDDTLDQVRKYIGRRVRNRMIDWLREFAPKWWLEVKSLDKRRRAWCDDYAAEGRCAPIHSTEDILAVIRNACQNDDEWEMIQLRWTGSYTQAEIAERLKLTRDDVQRSLTRILYEVEDELDLPHKGGGGRKRRRKP
jgi:RNA polymerase sigma factor (sigma-70 family)